MVQGFRERGEGGRGEGVERGDVGKGSDNSWVWNTGWQMHKYLLGVRTLRRVTYRRASS